jgi:predicted ester cyclase
MKKICALLIAAILFAACQQGPARYTQNSPEIDTVKQLIANYNSKTYLTDMYADTSKTSYNTRENTWSPAETMAYHQESDKNYKTRKFTDENQEYEMVLTDDGNTWVNCWLDWQGTLAANNKEFNIPVHLTFQFIDGKIVREHGHWDASAIVVAMHEIEAQMNSSVEEKTIRAAMNTVTKAWNSNDKDAITAAMTSKFIRTENGNVIAKNPKDYAGFMDVYHGAFPDFTVKIDKSEIIGNMAYVNWTCTGTNTGKFMENDPTNKKIKTHGFSVWTFDAQGKSVREDAFYDNLVVFNQLGLTPPK